MTSSYASLGTSVLLISLKSSSKIFIMLAFKECFTLKQTSTPPSYVFQLPSGRRSGFAGKIRRYLVNTRLDPHIKRTHDEIDDTFQNYRRNKISFVLDNRNDARQRTIYYGFVRKTRLTSNKVQMRTCKDCWRLYLRALAPTMACGCAFQQLLRAAPRSRQQDV